MKEWNLGNGLPNVCKSIRDKLHYASHRLECIERDKTIINVDTYETTVLLWALGDYMQKHNLEEGAEE